MADAKEWFEVAGHSIEFSNLEEATAAARRFAMQSDAPYDIYRVTRVPVRCIRREISITETDLPVTREA